MDSFHQKVHQEKVEREEAADIASILSDILDSSKRTESYSSLGAAECTGGFSSFELQSADIFKEDHQGPIIDPEIEKESRLLAGTEYYLPIMEDPPDRLATACDQSVRFKISLREDVGRNGESDKKNRHGGMRDKAKRKPLAKKHRCGICDKKFDRPSALEMHLKTHSGEKPFVCQFPGCAKAFSVLSNAKRHQATHPGMPYPQPREAKETPYSVGFETPIILPPHECSTSSMLSSDQSNAEQLGGDSENRGPSSSKRMPTYNVRWKV